VHEALNVYNNFSIDIKTGKEDAVSSKLTHLAGKGTYTQLEK
jgi:hypothetical protein